MSDADLIARAEAAGVCATYLDWRRRRVQVPERTLVAILDALGVRAGAGADRSVAGAGQATGQATGALPRLPEERAWGLAVQLYSVRSRQSWGHGDFRDLAELAKWSARSLGAGFILMNPLHAAEPAPPLSNSPYLPMTRRFLSPLYIRVEDIPEYQRLTRQQRQQVTEQAGPLRAASRTPDLIDRDQVWKAKRHALELVFATGLTGARAAGYEQFAATEGEALRDWAMWCALAEIHGSDWRRWPARLADPHRAAAARRHGELAGRIAFHTWLQWIADEQLAEAQRMALAAGMSIGLIADLAVGVHPGGADAWAHQDLLVRGMSVGAPPDSFNERGQDWTQPPLSPARLASTGGQPFAELLGAAFRHAGALRLDHVMGLTRLWWIPDGMRPDQGAYVTYDHELMAGTLAGEAARAGALAIGEDLGTVEPWIRSYLAGRHILGTEMAWFARQPDGSLRPPDAWRRWCMATVGTHDVPPIAGFVAGDQVTVRERLGLLSHPQDERSALERSLADWRAALGAHRLLPPGREPTTQEMTVALYGYLALTPAVLVGVGLADAVGDRRTQNIPGTVSEYPNWRIPLCNADGESVLIEDLAELPMVRNVVRAATGRSLTPPD
ncbi:MAG TPA: 4-alpha-glucanotransferase [Streptosporangiaceae bacterium]|nr:4-alpha-glucanotransferase [Streptosporangiaceae bacterium]